MNFECLLASQGDYIYNHLRSISITSKLILIISLILMFTSFLLFGLALRSQEIVVLLIAFLQPFIILYFVYWRARRQHASLDLVIKCFFVGFWFTTLQSMVLEALLQVTIILILSLATLGLDALFLHPHNGWASGSIIGSIGMSYSNLRSNSNSIGNSNIVSDNQSYPNGFYNTVNNAVKQYSNIHLAIFGQSRMSYLGSPSPGVTMALNYQSRIQWVQDLPQGYSNVAEGTPPPAEGGIPDKGALLKAIVISNPFVVIVGAFLMAFVIAAGVEETCKHFIIRCCPFVTPLKNPHSILGTSSQSCFILLIL